jgi:peroxiredoxin
MAGTDGGVAGWSAGTRDLVSRLLAAGGRAPDFSAEASDGRVYLLGELLTDSRVLLAFYPGNDTPG